MNANKLETQSYHGILMMNYHMKKKFFFGAVRDKEEVSPANIETSADSRNGEDYDDLNAQLTSAVQAFSVCLLGRDGTP